MIQLMQLVALTAVLGCFLPTTVITAQSWGPVQFCPRGQKAIGFQLIFEGPREKRLVAIIFTCTRGSRITSPPGTRDSGISGQPHFCRSGRFLTSCQLQLERRSGANNPANNLNCNCSDGQTLLGDGSKGGYLQGWSRACRNGIVGIQTKAETKLFYIYEARFPCFFSRESELHA